MTKPIKFAEGCKLKFDKVRNTYVVLSPERVLVPSETSIAVFKLIDGIRTQEEISHILAEVFTTDYDVILSDVTEFLSNMKTQGIIS